MSPFTRRGKLFEEAAAAFMSYDIDRCAGIALANKREAHTWRGQVHVT
jgi:hypothetical protein